MSTGATPDTMKAFRLQRDVVVVQGPDTERYLQSQLSQQVEGMPLRSSRYSLLLQPTGRLEAVVRVTRFDDTVFVLDAEPGSAEAMVARLNRFKIRVDAQIQQLPWQCVALRGPNVRSFAQQLGRVPSDGLVVDAWWGGDDAVDLLGATVADVEGVTPMDAADFHRLRVASRWPMVGVDIEPGCVPAETGLLSVAVSFAKGCYPGQELVERMDSRAATAPRELRCAVVPDGTAAGDAFMVNGADAGVVTSVSGTNAIVRVSRDALDATAPLSQ
jgi:folate-binding protein YgfZ